MANERIYYSRDAEIHAMHEMTRITLIYLALGVGIGAALALLFAPTSGKKIRADIARMMEERMKSSQEALDPAIQRLEKEFSELRKTVTK